ncbi:hypothetical protein N9L47_05845 [Rhodobacteraceae bacterium]|nr:hypothetical protein [Paracoccaceae bacterium]
MITSVFLLFFAFGIALAAIFYGFGGIFPVLVALSVTAVAVKLIAQGPSDADHDQASA